MKYTKHYLSTLGVCQEREELVMLDFTMLTLNICPIPHPTRCFDGEIVAVKEIV